MMGAWEPVAGPPLPRTGCWRLRGGMGGPALGVTAWEHAIVLDEKGPFPSK